MEYRIKLSEEVRSALESGRPVIALESTIISHGMPYPQNMETAMGCMRIARKRGVVPAVCAIIGGRLCAGLTDAEIEYLAKRGHKTAKASRRDIPYLAAKGLDGATTVAATMFIAAKAGIPIFATGGIGGVHKGAETSMDISCDLMELARTPVAVVCAGVKSILDIGLTLEYLETQGVPVIGYKTNYMPAFYTRDSGYDLLYRADSAAEVAEMVNAMQKLNMQSGMIIANPVPVKYELDETIAEKAIAKAQRAAEKENITGKEVTPFMLKKVVELTDGRSLQTNIALVYNNVRLAAEAASILSGI